MFICFKKTTWAALAAALLITACGKEAKVPAPTAATPAPAPAQAAQTYTAADFTTAGLVINEGVGKDYQKVATPQPLQVAGKIEVLEFFWYGCPHCSRIDPAVTAWKKTISADVNFIRVHVFWGKPMDEHQKIFYALGVLKQNDTMDDKVFGAIHNNGMGLAKPELITEFMVKNGIDKGAWESAYSSFTVNTEAAKANALFKSYGLSGVPNFVVNGKYIVGGETTRTLQVVNKLIELERGKK